MRFSFDLRWILVAAVVMFFIYLFCAGESRAQTPAPHPDVDLARSGSTYPITCQPTDPVDKLEQICAVRTDLEGEPVELGCTPHTSALAVTFDITVARTPFQDGEIRCYAIDSEGNVSDLSDNVGRADFTPNGKPVVK